MAQPSANTVSLDVKHHKQEHHSAVLTGGQSERKMWKKAIHSPVTEDLPYMFATLCEYASGVCDTEYNLEQFFEDMELPGNDFAYASILRQAIMRGLLPAPLEVNHDTVE